MHDVGKIGLPDELLRKLGPYSPDERTRMRHHTTIGAAGAHFDPALFATFLTMREQLRAEGTAPSGRLHAA